MNWRSAKNDPPQEHGVYLVASLHTTMLDLSVDMRSYYVGHGWRHCIFERAVAWMPLPPLPSMDEFDTPEVKAECEKELAEGGYVV